MFPTENPVRVCPARRPSRVDASGSPGDTRRVSEAGPECRDTDQQAGARYLIRLDDACATMPRAVWDHVGATLTDAGISPLVAVIPENRDRKMLVDDPDPRFWERVRRWQAEGWSVGVHGLHHVTRTWRGRKTEFAGLPAAQQTELLDAALAIFAREEVRPDAWIAPNHTFDRTTVRILASRGLSVISDGFAVRPYRDANGVLRVPQQLWRFEQRPPGVWTICKHPNGWSDDDLVRFDADVRRFADRAIDLPTVVTRFSRRRRDAQDIMFGARRWAKTAAARAVGTLTRGSEAS